MLFTICRKPRCIYIYYEKVLDILLRVFRLAFLDSALVGWGRVIERRCGSSNKQKKKKKVLTPGVSCFFCCCWVFFTHTASVELRYKCIVCVSEQS